MARSKPAARIVAEEVRIPNDFSGVALEILDAGKVTGRWFITAHHPIARRLVKELRVSFPRRRT